MKKLYVKTVYSHFLMNPGHSLDTHTQRGGLLGADAGFRDVVVPVLVALLQPTAL